MRSCIAALLVSIIVVLHIGSPAIAAMVEIQMLNKDPDNKRLRNVFRPAIIRINSGDTVRFVSVDRGHNSQSLEGMIPEGAEEWYSKVGQDFEIKLTVPGVYGYRCTPHYGLGMVGLIVVSDEADTEIWKSNLESAKKCWASRQIQEDV